MFPAQVIGMLEREDRERQALGLRPVVKHCVRDIDRGSVLYFQGRKRVIQRRFNVGVLEAIPKRKASTL